MSQYLIFIKNEGELPLPRSIIVIMLMVFGGIPLMLFLTTVGEVAKEPWVILLWIGSLFPLGVMFVLKRVMGRYAMGICHDGTVEIVYPFKTLKLLARQIATVSIYKHQNPAKGVSSSFLVFGSSEGKSLANVAMAAFKPEDLSRFLQTLAQAAPSVRIVI